MLLKITHRTDLTYTDLISESVMELRMVPRQEQDQRRLSFSLAIGPATVPASYYDWLGNTVHAFTINDFHDRIKIVATSVVETERPALDPRQLPDTWPIKLSDVNYQLLDFLGFGGPVDNDPGLQGLVEQLYPFDGLGLGEIGMRMINLINSKFTYEPGVTTSASPICETLAQGAGVCQDFTHLMIGIARAMKIPARYVSGLLHPEAERFRGYSQTHAWVELYFPSTGWVGFDPTNRTLISENFVKVAVGRDFRDVPPNKGVFRGNATESITAEVHSELLNSIPPELATDRTHQLNDVPTFPARQGAHRDQVVLQQEQQQQQ
jgi:transglutaminase-like putative cysteine protease